MSEYKRGHAKLTKELKDALLLDYVSGMKIGAIAAKYGVDNSYPGILAARKGLNLRHHITTRRHMSEAARYRRRND